MRLRDGDAIPETSLHEESRLLRTPLQRAGRRSERRERRDRQPEVGDDADVDRASVTCGANPHDRDRHTFDPDRAADQGRIRTELPGPGRVPDDGHDCGIGRVLRGVEPAPERRPESQHGQIRRRGVFGDRRPQRALVQVVHAARDQRGGRGREDVGVRRHVQVRRVRVRIHASGVGGVLIHVDETVGIGKRLLAEERRVDEAEDGGSGADAKAENEDGGGREAPVAGEAPDCVARVAQERVHGPRDGLIAHVAVAALTGMPIIMFYRFDPAEMLRLTEKWHGSFTVAAITVFIALLNHPDIKMRNLSSMKKIYSGGAPVSPAIVENFQEITGAYIHNIYGLTETTSPSHATPLGGRAPVDPDSGALAVGVPIPNTICRVVDVTTGEDLPVGEVGELITKGPEVVAGYWQKPEETANAIRDGYLYTGDVAKMDEEGWFYIVDRKKDMIIVSGYKVWPRDVEDTLYQHPAVREAAVIGVADAYRGETVKAYVALKSGYEGKVKPEELIEFCKERMANYKYPRHIEFLDEVPKTVTGKFLRRELRDKARQ